MFEGESNQNGNQSSDQSSMAQRIANMLRVPQTSGKGSGDFVNQNPLRLDPQTGTAFRQWTQPADAVALSPTARQLGDLAANAGKAVRDPVTVLQEQQAEYGEPIPIRDAQGKMNPKYRMGVGHRILATVANFANGFAGNHVPPIYVGPGAVNHRYYEDEAMRQQNLENVERQLASQAPPSISRKPGVYSGPETGPQEAPKAHDQQNTSALPSTQPATLALQPSARQQFAQLQAARLSNTGSPRHRAFNPQTREYIGSNDGMNWFPLSTNPTSA